MTGRKLLKALLVAALIFVFAAFSAACGADLPRDEAGPSDYVSQPEDSGDGANPGHEGEGTETPEPDVPDTPINPDPEVPIDPDVPDPDPEVPIDPDLPDPDPEVPIDPDLPDPDPEVPIDPDVPDPDPEVPIDPDVPDPDPEVPIDPDVPDTPDPDTPIDPEPDPEIPDKPDPIIYNYSFVYGPQLTESVGGEIAEGGAVEAPAIDVSMPYYEFREWQVNGQAVDFPYTPAADTVFTAVYAPIRYKITYVTNGGTNNGKNPEMYSIESTGLRFAPIVRPCYEFGGWYIDETLSERCETPPYGAPQDITLYAKWENPAHDYAADHVCSVCGEATDPAHRYTVDHVCAVCSDAHAEKNHTYNESHVCTICKAHSETAVHVFDTEHTCTVCRYETEKAHEYGADYLCIVCGAAHGEGNHRYYASHVCTVCGKPHANPEHVYNDDYHCEICGALHAENLHRYNALHVCAVCGKPHANPEHVYNDDYFCEICGREFDGVRPWKGDIAAAFAGGDGTAAAPYEIGSGAELALLATLVNDAVTDGDGLYLEKYYLLTADIDLGGREWTPIGRGYATALSENFDGAFKGHFAGNGKTIGNFKITAPVNPLTAANNAGIFYSVGLFGALGGGSVTDLRITGLTVDIAATVSATYNAGGLVGIVSSHSSVSSCYVDGNINLNIYGDANAGLLVGNCEVSDIEFPAIVENCRVRGTVGVKGTKQVIAGGMIGVTGQFKAADCYADVDVTAESAASAYGAGLIGFYKVKAHVDNCYALGNVAAVGKSVYVDGFAYRTVPEKWIEGCLRLETQTLTGNGKPVAGKTAAAAAATAAAIEEASETIFGNA